MKTVNFKNENYEVEDWVNWITSDDFGICVWEHEPVYTSYGWASQYDSIVMLSGVGHTKEIMKVE